MDVRIENVTMEFQNTVAVNSLSTTIRNGEMVSLLGPSGCGKSTTLMLLAGLYKPTCGNIYFGEKNVTNIDAEKREIGMVFQNYALYPHLSVLKNIMFPLRMQKVPKREAKDRAMEMARLVQIGHLVDRKPGQLSGGQQQRVAIARALVKKPNLLLLDEPLSNLDARLRLEMREEIRRIQQEVGITAIFVTHDQEEALSISDRVMLMKDGVLQQDSIPQEMYRKPINSFAAAFIGNPPINFLLARKTEQAGNYELVNSSQIIKLPGYLNQQKIQIGLRPENLFLTDKDNALLTGEVIHLETIGRDTLIRVQIEDVTIRALIDPSIPINVGDQCHLGIEQDHVHYFDTENGSNLERGNSYDGQANMEQYA
ncbi:multiple sugar transport system ATP-binding protein [Gracilibacillus ureilyticus]|uniref:Multiple sugar transport system ATP-binding protein n=1 Tax=Gracilibacillus ureilyticus TaxID=531814 RepID=A0A1H9QAE6_9BACI|nr:ABC transporter ATP-binding protein [Gracilibacillus ureilyticus]SER56839.1 multiple sugar transport system ATP-binding protein [Gracilibacillus ureilyticus]